MNNDFGYVGAGIVACFILAASGFYLTKKLMRRMRKSKTDKESEQVRIPVETAQDK